MAIFKLSSAAENLLSGFKKASGISALENIAGGIKKVANIVFDDQPEEVVNQTSRFSIPQFSTPVSTIKEIATSNKPVSTKMADLFGNTMSSVGKSKLPLTTIIPSTTITTAATTFLPTEIKQGAERTIGSFGKSIVFNSLGIAEATPEFLSKSIKIGIDTEKEVRAEAEKLPEKERLIYLSENNLAPVTSGYDTREWTANKLQQISDWAARTKENNKDLYPDPKFSEQPLSENMKDPSFWANGIGGVIPSIISGAALGLGTAYITKNPAATGATLLGSSYAQEGGAAFQQAKDYGLDDKDALKVGQTVGIVNGILESILPEKIVGSAAKPIKQSIIKKAIRGILTNQTFFNMGTEALTETAQEFWSNVIRSSYDENAKLSDNLLESALFGGFGGLLGAGIEKVAPKVEMNKPSLGLGIEAVEETKPAETKPNVLNDLNPSGTVFTEWSPEQRVKASLGENMTTLDKTSGGNANDIITVYRGTPGDNIVAGDFITTNEQLAKDNAGTDNIISMEVKKGDILDDKTEPLGEEYIYRPGASEEINKISKKPVVPRKTTIESLNAITDEMQALQDKKHDYSHKIDEAKTNISSLKDYLESLPGKNFVKFMSKKEGQLLDFISNPKTESQKTKATELLKVSERAFEGTDLSKEYDNFDTINNALDEYLKLKSDIKNYSEGLDKIRAEKDSFVRGELLKKLPKLKTKEAVLGERVKGEEKITKLKENQEAKIANIKESRAGIIAELKNRFEAEISDIERQQELDKIKRGILTRHQQAIKDMIVKYAKDNLPTSSRGKFLQAVADAKTQKDLVRSFLRIDNEVQSLQKKEIISKLKDDISRVTDAQNIAIDVKNRIIDLFKGIDLTKRTQATIDTLNATKRYIEIKKSEGEDVAMPERILEKLQILAMKSTSEMTVEELTALRNEVVLLEQIGKTKLKSREEIYKYERETRSNELSEKVVPIKINVPQKASPGESLSLLKKASNKMKTALNIISEKHIMIKPMDGIAEMMNMESFKEKHDINNSNFLEELQSHLKDRKDIVNKYDLNNKNMERAGIVALSKQEGGVEKLIRNGMFEKDITEMEKSLTKEDRDNIESIRQKFIEDQFDKMEESLTEGEKAYVAFVRKEFDEIYPRVKEFARVNYNTDVGHIDDYVPFITDYEAMSDIPVQDRFGELAVNAIALRKNVDRSFIKNRIGAGNQKIQIDLDKIYLRHMTDALYMLHMSKDIKMDAEIIRTPEMSEKMGNLGNLIWSEWLDLMARGGSSRADTIAAIDFFRRNTTGAILSYRLSSALLQTSAIVNGMSEIGGFYGMNGASKIAFSKQWREFINNNFPEIMATVGDDPSFIDLGEGWLSKVTKAGVTPLVKLDMIARSSVAVGAYIREMNRKGIEVDLSKPDKEAITVAQRIVRKTQGSSLSKDQPLAISSGSLTARGVSLAKGQPTLIGNRSVDKMLTALQSFVFSNWDNIESNVWRQGIKKGDLKKASSGIIWLLIVAPLAEMGLRDASKWIVGLFTGTDDDKEDKDLLARLIEEDVGRIPFVGQLLNSLRYGSNPVPIIQTMEKLSEGAYRVATGKKEETRQKGVVDVLSGLGALGGGLPTQLFDISKALLKSTGANELDTGLDLNLDIGNDINMDLNLDLGL